MGEDIRKFNHHIIRECVSGIVTFFLSPFRFKRKSQCSNIQSKTNEFSAMIFGCFHKPATSTMHLFYVSELS